MHSSDSRKGQGATQPAALPAYRPLRAQGATEYLVVLSVVLIIGLVSVSLLGFFPGTAKDATSNAAAAYWQGAALPFRVVEVSQTNGSNLAFVLENA